MATKRTPIGRRPTPRITPKAIEAFRTVVEILKAGDSEEWEPAGRRREYLTCEQVIDRELHLPPWFVSPTEQCLDDPMPDSMKHLAAAATWPEAVALRAALFAALDEADV